MPHLYISWGFILCLLAIPPSVSTQHSSACSVWATSSAKDRSRRKCLWPGASSVMGHGEPVPPYLITVPGRRGLTLSDLWQGWCLHPINNNISQSSSNYRPIPEAIKLHIWKKGCFLSLMNVNSSPEPEGDMYECPTVTMKSNYK